MNLSAQEILTKIKNLLKNEADSPKTIADYNRELLINQGRDQFKKLIEKGLSLPVNLA